MIEVIADGDISEWDKIRGFTGSEGYSRSLMVFQASLIRIASLVELDSEKDAWLANRYARELFKTSRTYNIIYNTSGREALDAGSGLHVAGGQEWVDNRGGLIWKIKESGILPFDIAHLKKVHGYITASRAVYEKAIFLDASGRPVSGGGKYAWIWDSGKVYKLRDGERNTSNISGRDNSPASPGNTVGAPSPGGDPDDGDNGDDGNDNGDDGNDNGDDGDDNGDNGNDGGPGNGNGNNGNPGNGGGNTGGSGPGSGNGGDNNGNNDNSGGGNDGNNGNDGGSNGNGGGSRSGLGDGTNPGAGSGNNNAGGSAGGTGTDNPGEN